VSPLGHDGCLFNILKMVKMILLKKTVRLLFLFILALSFGRIEIKAQDFSIVTTLISPLPNSPQIAGATLTYQTTVSYTNPTQVTPHNATVTLNFNGMELLGSIDLRRSSQQITYANIDGTSTNNVYAVTGFKNAYYIRFEYTCEITKTNSSAVNTASVTSTDTDMDPNNNVSVLQTFIKPILDPLATHAAICSEKSVNEPLTADNPYSSYRWAAAPNANTVVQGPIGSNTIQDIVSNTGNADETVVYTVTPQIVAPTISSTGNIGPVSTTTLGTPRTFNVTVLAPTRVLLVAITGNGVIYSDESAVFTPNGSIPSATYTWYDSMNKSNVIGHGVLTKSDLSVGTHTFYVTATGPNSCEGPALSAQVTVLPLPIKVRKSLTPNGDEIEDTWIITDIDQFPKCSIKVFNIFGTMVYSSTGYGTPWIGTFHDSPLPVGTYYYTIDLNDGNRPLSGYVAILR